MLLDLAQFYQDYLLALHLIAANIFLAVIVSVHAVINKRDTRAVISWVGLVWLAPYIGSLLYLMLGINRIHRSAAKMELRRAWEVRFSLVHADVEQKNTQDFLQKYLPFSRQEILVKSLTNHSLLPGNHVTTLRDGDQAYPAMLAAINEAQSSITLLSYIFDSDKAGEAFFQALCDAHFRGVDIRVLVDAVGARYSSKNMVKRLKAAGLNAAAFLPTRTPRLISYANLRNHRKILVVDGAVGFTGGTNIRESHWLKLKPTDPVHCLHFRFDGPVVEHLQEAFCIDWAFTTGESLSGTRWFDPRAAAGNTWARGIADGPDEDLGRITYTLLGALSMAAKRVCIVTPYFIPSSELIYALELASLRGVEVDIILPKKNNIRLVQWASQPLFPYLMEKGCRIHLSPEPFDHSKLLVVDDTWSFLGSTNWDPRSLRLNFEFNVECYDAHLAGELTAITDEKIARAKRLTVEDVESLNFVVKIRNGLARILSPYL